MVRYKMETTIIIIMKAIIESNNNILAISIISFQLLEKKP